MLTANEYVLVPLAPLTAIVVWPNAFAGGVAIARNTAIIAAASELRIVMK